MKNRKINIGIIGLAVMLMISGCGRDKNQDQTVNSQTTANDSSAVTGRKALGVGEDNQNEVGGYPSNQSNLNSDSTRKLHDDDTTSKKPLKDRPHPDQ